MRTICFYFQVHQPLRLRRYRFFDIGASDYYYDDFSNKALMRKIAERCYLPANELMLKLIEENKGKFRISYSISGLALEQFEKYAPAVLESFKKLATTGCVEFLGETYAHSLASLHSKDEFTRQVALHSAKIEQLFGQKPQVFRNTELIYDDSIGQMVADLGFKAMLTEGAKHILGWKSPNFLYYNVRNPKLKLLLKNFKLSDDIAFRFADKGWTNYPLTADKYVAWLNAINDKEEIINLFMDYEAFGEHQPKESGIFDFMGALPANIIENTNFTFHTPSEVAKLHQPIAPLNVPYPISWADEERDLTAWLGNELQKEAFNKLYGLADKVNRISDPKIKTDWQYLQASDHFYYMCTKVFSDGAVHQYFNPFQSPYDAFINYMNVVSDFIIRVNKMPLADTADELPVMLNSSADVEQTPAKKEAGKTATDETLTTELRTIVFNVDGRMTVKSLKQMFEEILGISVRVFKDNKLSKKAENSDRLKDISKAKTTLGKLGALSVAPEMTVKDFEKAFKKHYKIAIQLADKKDKSEQKATAVLADLNEK